MKGINECSVICYYCFQCITSMEDIHIFTDMGASSLAIWASNNFFLYFIVSLYVYQFVGVSGHKLCSYRCIETWPGSTQSTCSRLGNLQSKFAANQPFKTIFFLYTMVNNHFILPIVKRKYKVITMT